MKQKLFTLFLALVANVGMIYASNTSVGGIWYNFNSSNKTATVTYHGDYYYSYFNEYSGSVVIPSAVTYNGTTYSVTSIGDEAFRDCESLTSVTIPNSVTSIGDRAFNVCSSLIFVIIPNSVTSIGSSAFRGCHSLTFVTIPNSVTRIGGSAFSYCSSLTSVTIGNSVTIIGEHAFYNCESLTSITIPNSVTSIGDDAFYGCTSLTSVTINSDAIVTSFNMSRIFGSQVTECIIGESVTSIGNSAFSGCKSLTSVTIGNSVTIIGEHAFYNCESLTSITIPNSVTSIGDFAFEYCSSLTSVTIPNSVTSIGTSAFYRCDNITSVHITDIAAWCKISFVNHYANPLYYAHNIYLNGELVKDLVIPNGVTSIGDLAFDGCSSLTSITIPNSVTSIGDGAFYGCSSLTKTNYTGDIAGWCNIMFGGGYANPMYYSHNFYINDQEVTDLVIPNSVTSIGSSAFYDCTSLTSVTIPNSVTSIGDRAFYGCEKLVDVYCYATTPPEIDENTFSHYNAFLYVPCESKKAYMVHAGWGNFKYIECISSEGIEDVQSDEVQSTKVIKDGQVLILRNGRTYTMQGQEVN